MRISPVRATHIELHAAVVRSRKRDLARAGMIYLDPMPAEACGRTFDGNDYCTLADGHRGPCNVKRKDEEEL